MKVLSAPMVSALLALAAALPALAAEQGIVETYKRSCIVCHAAGASGAPRTGADQEWQSLLEQKGIDALVQSVKNGLNAMPPKGLCFECSEAEYKALIEYMAAPQG